MAFAPITKLEKFTSEENNAQAWINDQGNTEAVTTYLECFHRNLHQIQAIQADYFTVPQILNQFIRCLHSSILQQVHLIYSVDLPTTVTYARDFEAAKLEANHVQAVNLVMNGSSDLDSKLKQFSDSINQKLKRYLKREFATTVVNKVTLEPIAMLIVIHDQKINIGILIAVISENAASSKQETNQKPLTRNIPPAASTEDESLAAIFPFELEEIMSVLLFNEAALNTKPITTMYTNAKVNVTELTELSAQESSQPMEQPKQSTYTCTSHVWPLQDYQYTNTTH
ncbi:hypothetical protein G9A89_015202 [Geosiphon pyriformis]|nr:hypothetical protein G9A89_015202 [Geosiphon pyriformis]